MKRNLWVISGIIIVIILGVVGYFCFSGDNNSNDSLASENQTDYVGEQITSIHKNFRAIIKADWQELEGASVGYSSFVYLPPNEDKEDINAEFIFVSTSYLGVDNNYTLEWLLDAGIENSKQTMPDIELTENIDKEGEYLIGKEIKFTGTSEGVKRDFVQFFGIKYGNIYTITYSCPVDTCDYYAVYNVFVNSFKPIE